MDSHTIEVLDFPRVREVLAGLCQTDAGKELALGLSPSADRAFVLAQLDQLDETCALPDEPVLSDVKDLRPVLVQLRAAGVLSAEELLRVRMACTAVRKARDFFNHHRDQLKAILPLVGRLVPQPGLEKEIDRAIDEVADVRDTASPELADIRRRLKRMRNGLVEKLERMAADNPAWFGGGAVVRGGRFVLPLLAEHRGRINGVIHDSSGTGHTLFVEPFELVGDGNELQELHDAETEEVAKILRTLSHQVAQHEPELAETMAAAADLDLLVAKRRFARRFDCERAEVATNGTVEVRRGRHPLLVQRRVKVVPLDFRFPDGASVVIISGPNAGGKTVVLKTLGLLSLMLGAGMYLPAAKGTCLPLFERVFADIGDEQSLDSDLSSFTAHVCRLKEILDSADGHSLVLIDEIGASTSPEEGAALAVAVLEALRDSGVKTLATTHFGVLKMFAQDEPGMVNAAMEFRKEPTYRMKMGFPGESSAFEIAAGAGLAPKVVERAKSRIGREWLDLGSKLRSLDDELHRAQTARAKVESEQQQAQRLRQEYDAKIHELRQETERSREKLRAEEERFLREKRREIENLVRQIREQNASHESVVAAKQRVAEELEQVESVPEPATEVDTAPVDLKTGDAVESLTFRRQGVVVDRAGDRVTVAFGQIRMELNRQSLRLVAPAEVKPEPEQVMDDAFRFDPKLKVLGMTREEALDALDKFVDEASATGTVELRILHGKGTGVLRKAVWDRLKRDARVEEVKLAEAAEGGAGVTVVKLKSDT